VFLGFPEKSAKFYPENNPHILMIGHCTTDNYVYNKDMANNETLKRGEKKMATTTSKTSQPQSVIIDLDVEFGDETIKCEYHQGSDGVRRLIGINGGVVPAVTPSELRHIANAIEAMGVSE